MLLFDNNTSANAGFLEILSWQIGYFPVGDVGGLLGYHRVLGSLFQVLWMDFECVVVRPADLCQYSCRAHHLGMKLAVLY